MAYVPNNGSVVAFQGNPSVLQVLATVTNPNQSVSGLIGASIIGLPTFQTGVNSIITVWQSPSIVGTYAEDAGHTTGDKGLMHLGVRNDTGSVLSNADQDYIPFTTDSAGQVRVTNGNSWIPSVYAVLSSITTVSIMNANQNRKGGTIYNAAGTNVFIKLGTGATTSVYTVLMNANDYYELPYGYVGVVGGITSSNAGIINVTEIT